LPTWKLEVSMSTTARNRRFSLVGTLIVSALGLCAVAIPLSPAKAQGCLGLDVNGDCVGLQAPGYYYGYYPYYYRGHRYYQRYSYCGYPAYGYPYYWQAIRRYDRTAQQ
jgi:hypothetical protein